VFIQDAAPGSKDISTSRWKIVFDLRHDLTGDVVAPISFRVEAMVFHFGHVCYHIMFGLKLETIDQ
jgi:hypothetical protein